MILRTQKGVALILVLSSITLLTALLADFSFDVSLNKLKVQNDLDKFQAKLNAEAGLNLAMVRLRLYKEARNIMEKNEQIKKSVGHESLDQIWSLPFILPIPVTSEMSLTQKEAVKEFHDQSLIQGSLRVSIQNASNQINVNLMRAEIKSESEKNNYQDSTQEDSTQDSEFSIEAKLTETLRKLFEDKKYKDDYFANKYANTEPEELVKRLKFYISDKESEFVMQSANIASEFQALEISPKHAPLTSISELYLIPGWDDTIVALIKNLITVHGSVVIDLNKINDQGLKMIFPNLTDEQVKDFFEYRDDPKDPKYFKGIEQFKNYIVNQAAIISSADFDDRIKKFKNNGVNFGVGASLFRILSEGEYGRSTYSITAYASLPARPTLPKKDDNQDPNNTFPNKSDPQSEQQDEDPPEDQVNQTNTPGKQNNKKQPPPLQFLEPRIIWYQAN